MKISPEESRRRSERAKQLYKEGKFGGPQPGSGRPRKKRASELVAEAAQEHAQDIIDAFRRGVKSQDERTAVMAAEKWMQVESKEHELQKKEQKSLDDMSRDELIALLAKGFVRLQGSGVNLNNSGVVDGTASEIRTELPRADAA